MIICVLNNIMKRLYLLEFYGVEDIMERLQKVIAQAGVASRRKAEELILEGRVTVNGDVVKS